MKVQLIVVQGKPEGKVIPLALPVFKIGRGETCNLRPGSEQVSREHAEFTLTADTLSVRDLGSRNGTLVNGKVIKGPTLLKDRDLVQVGPLTFAVSIQDAPVAVGSSAAPKSPLAAGGKVAPEDVSHDEIDSWLVADNKSPLPDRPSGIYTGDTITISSFKEGTGEKAVVKPAPKPVAEPEPETEPEESYEPEEEELGDDVEDGSEIDASGDTEEAPEEFVDESNPFHAKKKTSEPDKPTKPVYKDTSDAATDILRKMMDRRRSTR